MTISELIERSNPDDMDEAMGNEQIGRSKLLSHRVLSKNVLIISILILSTSASFGLGYLAGHQGNQAGGLVVGTIPTTVPAAGVVAPSALNAAGTNAASGSIPAGGEVVASSATHQYFLPWCAGATQIPNIQKVWFSNEQEAVTHGYAAGKGCGGI